MRGRFVALLSVLVLVPSFAAAQPLQSFQDLALRLNFDDRLLIEDQSGVRIAGRLARLTREEITLQTAAGEQRFTSATVRTITVRQSRRRTGVLVGAGVGAGIGVLAACWGSEREECVDAPLLLGGIGAAVGLAMSGLLPRATAVYASSTSAASSLGSTQPPGPFDDLALRVNLDDRVRVEDVSGETTTGRLTRLTGDEMTLETAAGEQRFTSVRVREVAVRGHSLGLGALIGAGAFTAALFAAPGCRSSEDCLPIVGAPIGAGVGLAVGALVPRMTTVFRGGERHASLSPMVWRGAVGVQAALRW